MPKRNDYISWDEYFMGVALLSSMRSKDPSTQVGACIVNNENRIVGVGYNGFPKGCSDDDFPWDRQADSPNSTKYPFVCHAELNAILNSNGNVKGARIYVALFPCNECAKSIIQAGISEVIYISDKYAQTDGTIASRKMLEAAGVKLTQFASSKKIEIDYDCGKV